MAATSLLSQCTSMAHGTTYTGVGFVNCKVLYKCALTILLLHLWQHPHGNIAKTLKYMPCPLPIRFPLHVFLGIFLATIPFSHCNYTFLKARTFLTFLIFLFNLCVFQYHTQYNKFFFPLNELAKNTKVCTRGLPTPEPLPNDPKIFFQTIFSFRMNG